MTVSFLQPAGMTVSYESNNIAERETVVHEPVAVEGKGIVFKPELMTINRPYPFVLLGVRALAVRRSDGRIDFYHLPSSA